MAGPGQKNQPSQAGLAHNLTESSSQLATHLSGLLTASALPVPRWSPSVAGHVIVVWGHAPHHVLKSGFAFFFLSSCVMPVWALTRAPTTVPTSQRRLASSFASCVPDLLALSISCCFSWMCQLARRYSPLCLRRWPRRSSDFLLAVFSTFSH
jgi:hypothetical protein